MLFLTKPWAHTHALSHKQKKTLMFSIAIGNIMSFANAMFAGTYTSWLLYGGQELVNLEHMSAGLTVFFVSRFIGAKDVFSTNFVLKACLLRFGIIVVDLLPLLTSSNYVTAIMVSLPAAAFSSMQGYRAKKSNVTWGYRPEALSDKNDFAVDMHAFEMAVLTCGAIVGATFMPSVPVMALVNVTLNVVVLILDINQNKLVVELEEEYNNQKKEG